MLINFENEYSNIYDGTHVLLNLGEFKPEHRGKSDLKNSII